MKLHPALVPLAVAALSCAAAALPATAQAARPTAAVVLGDSFSSGEGGRWRGNSFTGIDGGDRAGTDTAAVDTVHGFRYRPEERSYEEASVDNGCHRGLKAPVTYLAGRYEKVVNLACSGARAQHLWPIESGGAAFKGEAPQITQLGKLAATHDIKLVVLGIGGNDMGFGALIGECVKAWAIKHFTPDDDRSCVGHINGSTVPALGDVHFRVTRTIALLRKELAQRGQTGTRIVLTGYPAIIPGFFGFEFEAGDRRIRNCPFNGPDVRRIDEHLMPKLNATMEAIAHETGVDFIGLEQAFDGHKLCEAGTRRPVANQPPKDVDAEWVRYVDTTGTSIDNYTALIRRWGRLIDGVEFNQAFGDQGSLQESLHPNEFGQQAIGHCLRAYDANTAPSPKRFDCLNGASRRATDMKLVALPAPTSVSSATATRIPDAGVPLRVRRSVPAASERGQVLRSEIRIAHVRKGQLEMELIDPNGKVYPVKTLNPVDSGAFPQVWRTVHHDAPLVEGVWTLQVKDAVAGLEGQFKDWSLHFY